MGDVFIRSCTSGDLAAVQAIYAEHVLTGTGTFEIDPPDGEEIAARFRKVADRRLPWLVAERAGRVVGFAYAGPFRDRAAYARTVEDSVYVAAEAAGRGVGRALLTALIDAAAGAGAREMLAVIGDSRNAASVGLHAACGFRRIGVFTDVGFKFGRWLDVVLMQRSLVAGPDGGREGGAEAGAQDGAAAR